MIKFNDASRWLQMDQMGSRNRLSEDNTWRTA